MTTQTPRGAEVYRLLSREQAEQVHHCEGWIGERPCPYKPKYAHVPSGSAFCGYHAQARGEQP